MNKRGLSAVVVTVLIAVIAIASVLLVWSFVKDWTISNGQIFKTELVSSPDFSIVDGSVKLYKSAGDPYISFNVQRKANGNPNSEFYVLLEDSDGKSSKFNVGVEIGELETKKVEINYGSSGFGNLTKITLVSYISENGKDIVLGHDENIRANLGEVNPSASIGGGGGGAGSVEGGSLDSWNDESQIALRTKSYIYDWGTPVDSALINDNIIPFAWITWDSKLNKSVSAEQIKSLTDKMPEGHRVMIEWGMHSEFFSNPSDGCIDPITGALKSYLDSSTGKNVQYQCLWLENGVETTRQKVDSFFKSYKNIGGKIDHLTVDFESGFSYYSISLPAKKALLDGVLAQDPRYPELREKLGAEGFSDPDHPEKAFAGGAANDTVIWNYIATKNLNEYLTQAVCEPMWEYYPEAACSFYGHKYINDSYRVWDNNWDRQWEMETGSIAGNEQGPGFYGLLGNIRTQRLDGFENYWINEYNAFRKNVNIIRSSVLSSPNTKVSPWACFKEWMDNPGYKNYVTSDLYYDQYLHILMTTAHDRIFYWDAATYKYNAYRVSDAVANDSQTKVSKTLKEFDEICGYNDKKTLVTNISNWGHDFVLTGMYCGGRNVWRFTPNLNSSAYGMMDISRSLVDESSDVILKSWKYSVTIPQGKIYAPKNNWLKTGYWIVQPKDASQPVVSQNSNHCRSKSCSFDFSSSMGNWKFDGNLNDDSNNGANFVPATVSYIEGIGNGQSINSGRQSLLGTLPASSSVSNLNVDRSFTINLWINTNLSGYVNFLQNTAGGWNTQGWLMRTVVGGSYEFIMQSRYNSTLANTAVCYMPRISDGKWHMLTEIYDANEKMLYCYTDGYLADFSRNASSIINISSGKGITIYNLEPGSYLDEFAIFDKSLNSLEVRQLYDYQEAQMQQGWYRA